MPYRFVRPRSSRSVNSDNYFAGPWGLILGVGVLVVVAFGVIKLIQRVDERTEADKTDAASKGGIPGQRVRKAPGSQYQPPDTRKGPATAQQPARPSVQQALNELNVAVIQSEMARLRGEAGARGRYAEEAANALNRANAFNGPLPDHLEPGDQITAFETFDLMKMREEDAAARLARALDKKPFQTSYRFRVRRGGELELSIFFPAQTGATGLASASGRISISNQLALEIQKQVLSLPDGVLGQTERQEIERILGKGEASPEEYETLTRRLNAGEAAVLERETDFRTQIAKLQAMLPTGPVPDTLLTKEGKKIAGTIAGDTPAQVTMETSYGKISTAKPDVRHLYTADELREEFKRRLEGSADNVSALRDTLAWAKEWQLPVQKEYVAYKILQLFPQDPQARMEAGYSPGSGGRWILGNSIAAGAKPTLRKVQNRGDLQQELQAAGYVQHNERWFTKEAWSAVIDTLHSQPNVRMTMAGCEIVPWYDGDTPQARLFNPSGKTKDGLPPRLRFIGPSGATGTVTFNIDAPGDFLECSLRVSGSVVERNNQGKVQVFVTPEGAQTQPLYEIDQAANVSLTDISRWVFGKRKFSVTARLTTTTDKYHAYARLLESHPDSKEVFLVKATILSPAPDVDKTWASTRP